MDRQIVAKKRKKRRNKQTTKTKKGKEKKSFQTFPSFLAVITSVSVRAATQIPLPPLPRPHTHAPNASLETDYRKVQVNVYIIYSTLHSIGEIFSAADS